MTDKVYDVVFIGGGPGGYVGAIKAAQLGLKTASIEKRDRLGGTCLNEGCIPSKVLLNSTEKYEDAKHNFSKFGIKIKDISFDLDVMMADKSDKLDQLGKGIDGLFKKNKIDRYIGKGSIEKKDGDYFIVNSEGKDKKESIKAKNIVIATGSDIMTIPGIDIDEEKIVSSKGALELKKVPEKMIVIGGGYIGLEMGSVWSRLGAKVTVVEYLDKIVPAMDEEVGKALQKVLEKQGLSFNLGYKVLSAKKDAKKVTLEVEKVSDGKKEKLEADVVLVSIGRKPYTEGLGLDKIGVKLDERQRVTVDEHFQTNIKGIYAIGDAIPGPMLAHKAEEEGVAVAEYLAGKPCHVNYDAIPGVIYTWPEVATVGKAEQEVKKEGIEYKIGKFPFLANSRAKAVSDTEGFVKIITCAKTDKILGVHIIGPDAGTMIAEAVLAIEYSASAEDIARTCHAHPTLNEAMKEAALAAYFKPIHF